MKVTDEPGMLRAKLHPSQTSSGSGNNFATVLVVAEHADLAAFARTALAVKLRELDVLCSERDRLNAAIGQVSRECKDLANECDANDHNLSAAIRGTLRIAT